MKIEVHSSFYFINFKSETFLLKYTKYNMKLPIYLNNSNISFLSTFWLQIVDNLKFSGVESLI
jgi:hypothetical protein